MASIIFWCCLVEIILQLMIQPPINLMCIHWKSQQLSMQSIHSALLLQFLWQFWLYPTWPFLYFLWINNVAINSIPFPYRAFARSIICTWASFNYNSFFPFPWRYFPQLWTTQQIHTWQHLIAWLEAFACQPFCHYHEPYGMFTY